MIGREDAHRKGEDRARMTKSWLDASMRFSMDLLIYDADVDTDLSFSDLKVDQLVGNAESFDIFGTCLDVNQKPGRRVLVECKGYTTASTYDKNHKAYREYLAVAYSAMKEHANRRSGELLSRDFMYVSYHPFSISEHEKLISYEYVRGAIADHPTRVPPAEIDDDLIRTLCGRLWFSIADHRMEDMLMPPNAIRVMRNAILKDAGR